MLPMTEIDATLLEEVHAGLMASPRRLPPALFYDAKGSALFERITALPEYYPTRTERGILRDHAAEMLRWAGADLELVELGSGSSSKTHLLIQALLMRQGRGIYAPIDVSRAALDCANAALTEAFVDLEVHPICASYLDGLRNLPRRGPRRLLLFLGSTIGNFEPTEATSFLQAVRHTLRSDDALLIGMDQAKDASVLVPAYDDAEAVTAAFNLNVLARLNREWGATFELDHFRHLALWNERESRIEMHLESLRQQSVFIAALDLNITVEMGERIHTENSYKFRPGAGEGILQDAGWTLERTWMDERKWFAVHLARA